MARKRAIIVANGRFDDQRLPNLTTPVEDASQLGRVLQTPEIGAFDDVDLLVDQTESQVRRAILRLFARATTDDLLLLYFSGHGVLDDRGLLYFAARDTDPQELRATAVAASFVRQELDFSLARRQVVMLDCCNSGAFGRTKGVVGTSVGTEDALGIAAGGSGRVILTASDATQFAWEGDEVSGISDTSLFTRFIVQGLATGAADRDLDGHIGVDELYAYAYDQMMAVTTRQKPVLFTDKQQGTIILANNPRAQLTPLPLPRELLGSLEDRFPWVREGAVNELARMLTTGNPRLIMSAIEMLQRVRDEDDSRSVSKAAAAVLASYEQGLAASSRVPDRHAPIDPPRPVATPPAKLSPADKAGLELAHLPRPSIASSAPVSAVTPPQSAELRRFRQQLVSLLDRWLSQRITAGIDTAEALLRSAPDVAERQLSEVLQVDRSNARASHLHASAQRSVRQRLEATVATALVRAETMTTNELALQVLLDTLAVDPSNPIVQRRINERRALIERRQKQDAARTRLADLEQRVSERLERGEFEQAEADCTAMFEESSEFPEIRSRILTLRARISTEAAVEDALRKRLFHIKDDEAALRILEEASARYPRNDRFREQLQSQRHLIDAAERIAKKRTAGTRKGTAAPPTESWLTEDDVIEAVGALVREGKTKQARQLLDAARALNRIDASAAEWLERRHLKPR